MSRHVHIFVTPEDYRKYQEKHGHNILSKFLRLATVSSDLPSFVVKRYEDYKIDEKVFEVPIKTEYSVQKIEEDFVLFFKSKNNTEYRLDLSKEPNNSMFHLSFSLAKIQKHEIEDYEKPTDKFETYDILSRMVWILKDFVEKKSLQDFEFCIGATKNLKKNEIYKYILKHFSGWEKRNTDIYEEGWAIYFKI